MRLKYEAAAEIYGDVIRDQAKRIVALEARRRRVSSVLKLSVSRSMISRLTIEDVSAARLAAERLPSHGRRLEGYAAVNVAHSAD